MYRKNLKLKPAILAYFPGSAAFARSHAAYCVVDKYPALQSRVEEHLAGNYQVKITSLEVPLKQMHQHMAEINHPREGAHNGNSCCRSVNSRTPLASGPYGQRASETFSAKRPRL